MGETIEVEKDFEKCRWCYVSYSEWDTGYKEYGCKLLDEDGACYPEECPLSFKYKIEKDG